MCYRHPSYERIEAQHNGKVKREPGTEPVRTYFGRTARGGFFAGLEMPFHRSRLVEDRIDSRFRPNLKLRAGQKLVCEPMYLGVYARVRERARRHIGGAHGRSVHQHPPAAVGIRGDGGDDVGEDSTARARAGRDGQRLALGAGAGGIYRGQCRA